jgi:hypothetical protein
MICSGTRHSRFRRHSCLAGLCAFGMISFSASPRITAALLRGIKTIHIGLVPNRLHTLLAGSASTTLPARMDACSTFRGAIFGPICRLRGWPAILAIYAVLNPEQRRQFDAAVAVELKKGEASFHHPRMVHGSFANHSAWARRATVVNVMRDGVRSATNESLLHGVPVIPAGEKIEGQFFPLLQD